MDKVRASMRQYDALVGAAPVSIPVDKVRAEELFSAPPSDPNAVSIPVDKVRAKRIDFSDDGVTLGFNPRG